LPLIPVFHLSIIPEVYSTSTISMLYTMLSAL
jgi:hypothetical protein